MNIDWIPWIVRTVIIIVGIILAIIIWRVKKEGKYQEFYFRFYVIGATAFILGIILLIISSLTDLVFDYSLFLTATGAIVMIIGLVIRYTWEKKR